eukprot:jgi/Astpho2/8090/e_gw1.00120.109.1_t
MRAASDTSQQLSSDYIDLGHQLADAAAKITTQYFRSPVFIETKGDNSPVTEADRKAEEAMSNLIKEKFPDHSVFGEELGMHTPDGDSQYLWVLDPIDGTKSFITGKPTFGTLIALLQDGSPVLGILDQPISKERWVGAAGRGTTLNGQKVQARCCGDISLAYMDSTSPHIFSGETQDAFERVREAVRTPLYGYDCYAYGLLAAGFLDLVVEASLKPYDYMPLVAIVEGAGGIITDWEGQHLQWRRTSGQYALNQLPGEVIAAGDPAVHKQALEQLAWGETRGEGTPPYGAGATS